MTEAVEPASAEQSRVGRSRLKESTEEKTDVEKSRADRRSQDGIQRTDSTGFRLQVMHHGLL